MQIKYISNYEPHSGDFRDTVVVDLEDNRKYLFDPCGTYTELNDSGTKRFVQVVDELPSCGDKDVLYILRGEDKYSQWIFDKDEYQNIGNGGGISKEQILEVLGMTEQVIRITDHSGNIVERVILARENG